MYSLVKDLTSGSFERGARNCRYPTISATVGFSPGSGCNLVGFMFKNHDSRPEDLVTQWECCPTAETNLGEIVSETDEFQDHLLHMTIQHYHSTRRPINRLPRLFLLSYLAPQCTVVGGRWSVVDPDLSPLIGATRMFAATQAYSDLSPPSSVATSEISFLRMTST